MAGEFIMLTEGYSYANSEEVSKERFERWKAEDPFPEITPALLNSADILAYVKRTSLIYPFDAKKLKGASYDVAIEGDVVYWDNSTGKKQVISLKNTGDSFDLPPNSIAFVTLQPTFRIPYYLALRFNLKISHIYKGLLLGTGPLVDPGFQGKLSIPLHNLTSNTYRFFKGDELITMEFTKMSANQLWNHNILLIKHPEAYIKNDIEIDRTVDQYIAKALKQDRLNSVISSIPSALAESKKDVAEAQKAVKKIENKANWQTVISIAAVCTLVLTSIGLCASAFTQANERYDTLKNDYANMRIDYENRISELENQVDRLLSFISYSE